MSSPVATPAAPPLTGQSTAAASQTMDAILDSAPDVTLHMVRGGSTTMPEAPNAAKAPSFLLNFVGAGAPLSGVPCFSCVNGAEAGTLGISVPDNYVPSSISAWVYFMSFTSVTFTGKCTLAWAITSGKRVIDKFKGTATVGSTGPYFYAAARNRKKHSGSAVLTGKLTCGKKAQTTTAPVLFQ
jgi:hypothetical protein